MDVQEGPHQLVYYMSLDSWHEDKSLSNCIHKLIIYEYDSIVNLVLVVLFGFSATPSITDIRKHLRERKNWSTNYMFFHGFNSWGHWHVLCDSNIQNWMCKRGLTNWFSTCLLTPGIKTHLSKIVFINWSFMNMIRL